eukprot:PhM_4_TR3355/c0_g1_i1/m.87490/K11290/SET, TAF1, I2PP2A; template-activating factor I
MSLTCRPFITMIATVVLILVVLAIPSSSATGANYPKPNADVLEMLRITQDKITREQNHLMDELGDLQKRYHYMKANDYTERTVAIRSMPHFWKFAFLGHPEATHILSDEDVKLVQFIKEVEVQLLRPADINGDVRIWIVMDSNAPVTPKKLWHVYSPTKTYDGPISSGIEFETEELRDGSSFFHFFGHVAHDAPMEALTAGVVQELFLDPFPYFDHYVDIEKSKRLRGHTGLEAHLVGSEEL